MEKIDLKKELKELYKPSAREVVEVNVPQFNFLMIDGKGDPNTLPAYREAVEALFSASYAVKFSTRKGGNPDYAVMPLEGLWWADDMSAFLGGDKTQWKWTMMIMQPSFVTRESVESALHDLQDRKALPGLARLRLERFEEGRCAQVLHVGPFSEEGPAIQRVHDYIARRSSLRGKHHEIYLSDIRRVAPAKWRTIVRQPME